LLFEKISVGINRILASFAWILMGLEIIAVFAQIVIRLTRIQFVGITEISRLLFVWITFIGSTLALRKGLHISITILVDYLPKKLIELCSVFGYIVFFIFSVILIVQGASVTKVAMLQISSGLRISMGYFYMAIPISGLVMAIHSFALFYGSLNNLCKKDSYERGDA
jgi:TRAP-type C4-dicarboxylate transport system permease small subunit